MGIGLLDNVVLALLNRIASRGLAGIRVAGKENKPNEIQQAMRKISLLVFNILFTIMVASFFSCNYKTKADVVTEVSSRIDDFRNVGDSLYALFLRRKNGAGISRMQIYTGSDFRTSTVFQFENEKQVAIGKMPFSDIEFLKKIIPFPKAYFIDLYLRKGYIVIILDVPELRVSRYRTIYKYYFVKDTFEKKRKEVESNRPKDVFYLRDGVVIEFVRY